MSIDIEEIAANLAQDAIDNIDFMSVKEHLEFDLDIDDRDVAEQVIDVISTRAVAVIEAD